MNLLLIVDTHSQAAMLNSALQQGSYAVAVGGATRGMVFDDYLLLLSPSAVASPLQRKAVHEWIEVAVKTRMRPEKKNGRLALR